MDSRKNVLPAKRYSLISLILVLTAPIFAICFSFMMLTQYETDVHYFKHGSIWFGVFVGGVIAVGAAALIAALAHKKAVLPELYPINGHYNRVVSAVAGSLLLGFSVSELSRILTDNSILVMGRPVYGLSRLFAGRINSVTSVAAIVGIIAAFYFLMPVFSASRKNNGRVLLGCMLTVFFIFRLLVLYYDVTTPINSPVKMLEQMAVVGAMLFTVYEMRFLLCDPRPRVYVVVSTLAFILLASHSTSQIVASCFLSDMLDPGFGVFFELALAIYIFAGLVSYLTACKFYIPEEISEEFSAEVSETAE